MSRIHRTYEERVTVATGDPIEGIRAERIAQDRHWGDAATKEHTWAEWMLILGREVGEAQQEAGRLQWRGEWGPEDFGVLTDLRVELIQVAAVAVAIVERIDAVRLACPLVARTGAAVAK